MSGQRKIKAISNPFEQRLYVVSPRTARIVNEAASASVGAIQIDATGRTPRNTSRQAKKMTRRFSLNSAVAALAAFGTIMVATLMPVSIGNASLSENVTNTPTTVEAPQEKLSSGLTQTEVAALNKALEEVQARVESKKNTAIGGNKLNLRSLEVSEHTPTDINKGSHLKIGTLVVEDKVPTINIVRLFGQGKIRILAPVSTKRLPPIKLMADQLKIRVINPAGKKVNVGGSCGLPFDLSPFANHYDVASHAADETKDTQTPPKPSAPQTGERAYADYPLFKSVEKNILGNDFFAALLAKYTPQHTETLTASGQTRPLVPGYASYVSKPYPRMNVMARVLARDNFNMLNVKVPELAPKIPSFLSFIPNSTWQQLPKSWKVAGPIGKTLPGINKANQALVCGRTDQEQACKVVTNKATNVVDFYLSIAESLSELNSPAARKAALAALDRADALSDETGLAVSKTKSGLKAKRSIAIAQFSAYQETGDKERIKAAALWAAVAHKIEPDKVTTNLLKTIKSNGKQGVAAYSYAMENVDSVLTALQRTVYKVDPYFLAQNPQKPMIYNIPDKTAQHVEPRQQATQPAKAQTPEARRPVSGTAWDHIDVFGTYKTSSVTFTPKNG